MPFEPTSDRFDPASPIGTKAWWDYQLAFSWEVNGGPAQTTYFTEALIEHLPLPERHYLEQHALSILDWGCATGEGVAVMGRAFPLCRVTGLDIAESAIEIARSRHPAHEFLASEAGEILRPFDVVVTSNVLEHFTDPFTQAREHARQSRLLYLMLVPFRECPCLEGHLVRFTEHSFPEFLGDLVRLSITPFDANPATWAGQQALVIYGSETYVRAREETTSPRWDAYFRSTRKSRALIEALALRAAEAETTLDDDTGGARESAATVPHQMEAFRRLRERWLPTGTRRRRWLARLVERVLARA